MDRDTTYIGEYRVVRILGTGGMGEVFLVEHPRLPRHDALKLLDANISRNQEFRSRFKREADLLAPLQHPNIITIYDRGEYDDRLWLAMEYVQGQDAAKLLKSQGLLPLDLAMPIIQGASSALDYAYSEHQITHRDVKPANILVELKQNDDPITVKLVDFGIAKAAGESTSLTNTGVTIGTMSYISPEAIEGHELDNRADIYSLACTAFELLTGAPPYCAGTVAALMASHLTQPPPSITTRNPALPNHLDAVFARALAKEPDQRHQTCKAFVEALWTPAAPPKLNLAPQTPRWPKNYPAYALTVSADPQPFAPTLLADTSHEKSHLNTPNLNASLALQHPVAKHKRWLILLGVVLLAIAGTTAAVITHARNRTPTQATPATQSAQATQPVQTTLPYIGLQKPVAVAVDASENVYVADYKNNRVVKLTAGSSTQQALPFTGLDGPTAVAVDAHGNVYVADFPYVRDEGNPFARVVVLAAGSSTQRVLPFTGVQVPGGLAVDPAGSVYLADFLPPGHIVLLAVRSTTPRVLPFTSGSEGPNGLATDSAGNIYASMITGDRVVAWAAKSGTQRELPVTGLKGPRGLTVDTLGTVYVTDQGNNRVLKLQERSSDQQVLPFTGLNGPSGVAVDSHGNVYVADRENNRVVKLTVN